MTKKKSCILFHFRYPFDASTGTKYYFAYITQSLACCGTGYWSAATDTFMYSLLIALFYLVEMFNERLSQLGHTHIVSNAKHGNGIYKEIIDCIQFHIKLDEYTKKLPNK